MQNPKCGRGKTYAGEDQISVGKKRTSEGGSEETEHWGAWQRRASAIGGPGGQEDAGLENIVLVKKLKSTKLHWEEKHKSKKS